MDIARTLSELADHVAPREYRAWLRVDGVLRGDGKIQMSLKYSRNLERRAKALIKPWRARLIHYYDLHSQRLLPKVEVKDAKRDLFLSALYVLPEAKDRRARLLEEARRHARAEIGQTWRTRLRKRCEGWNTKLQSAAREALLASDVIVWGKRSSLRTIVAESAADRELELIPPHHIKVATLDISEGSMRDGSISWTDVVVVPAVEVPTKLAAKNKPLPQRQKHFLEWFKKAHPEGTPTTIDVLVGEYSRAYQSPKKNLINPKTAQRAFKDSGLDRYTGQHRTK